MSQPADILPNVQPPPYGRFIEDRVLAMLWRQLLPSLRKYTDWTGNPRGRGRSQTICNEIEVLIDVLETERHR